MAEGAGVGDRGRTVPSGIVTFLFTDVEGSTRLWAEDRDAMSASLRVHDGVLRKAFESRGGYVFTTAGDSFAVAFGRASDAVAAAESTQVELAGVSWPGPSLRVRMGLHLGEAEERGGDYFGPVVNLTARLEAAAHGGQVLLTDPVRQAAGVAVRDLGVHQLRDVGERVQIWQLGDGGFPALRVLDPDLTNLPPAVTGLVGRSEDLRRVRESLASSRVVTLTAGGGTGKTRLAMAVGEEELPNRGDGVWFVDLTPVTDGALVGPAVAAGLGLSLTTGDATEQILTYVAGKDLLLIVDNCEHLIDECAELAERFLARPGASVMLATSRERLDVDGELAMQVPPLSTDDDAGSAAVELYAQRAVAVNSSFTLTDENRSVVAQLCRRLDGMPLAIELAAARSTVMSPEELLAGIEDRFQLLHGGRRRQRQRTLEATLDWSYDLLEPDEQAVFRSLGVFVGTFDLDAVAAVAELSRAAAMDVIDSLIAKSLVVREETGGRSRFRLFETNAAYAEQRLADAAESADVRDAHLGHYAGLAQRHPLAMWADLAAGALLGPDRANLVAAFERAASQQQWATAARLLLGAFTVFYSHPTEGIELVDRCVERLADDEDDLAMRLVCNQWTLHMLVSDVRAATAVVRRLRDSPTPLHQVHGYSMLGFQFGMSDVAKGAEILERAFDIHRTLSPGHDTTQAAATNEQNAGVMAMYRQEPELALHHARAAIALHDELGFESEMSAHASMTASVCALMLGDPHTALEAANRYSRSTGAFGTGDEMRALVAVALGNLEQARTAARAHARVSVTGRVSQQATDSLLLLAVLADAEGDTAIARDLAVGIGLCRHGELVAYARHFADRLAIRAEFEAGQAPLVTDRGNAIKRRAGKDIETLRRELTRRGWQ